MKPKTFAWRKLTPAQIDLMERLVAAGGSLIYGDLEYRDLLAFAELQKLKFADMRVKGRRKLEACLTVVGQALQANGYQTDQVIVSITSAQIELLRNLHTPLSEIVGGPLIQDMPGNAKDVCRRMSLRGWVEWYEDEDGHFRARLTPAGQEVLVAIDPPTRVVVSFDAARRRRGLM